MLLWLICQFYHLAICDWASGGLKTNRQWNACMANLSHSTYLSFRRVCRVFDTRSGRFYVDRLLLILRSKLQIGDELMCFPMRQKNQFQVRVIRAGGWDERQSRTEAYTCRCANLWKIETQRSY